MRRQKRSRLSTLCALALVLGMPQRASAQKGADRIAHRRDIAGEWAYGWKRIRFEVHEGRVRGYMANADDAGRRPGDLIIFGYYDGSKLTGTYYARYGARVTEQCPGASGDVPEHMELTVSADGEALAGARRAVRIDPDNGCKATPRTEYLYFTRVR
jgi:hypothetical protein